MLLDLNPIVLHELDKTGIEKKLYKLREVMEDPANKLNISNELKILGDNKEQIYFIKD